MKRRVPHYWWDYSYDPLEVIVESTDGRQGTTKVLARWPGHTAANVKAASKMVEDLQAGRKVEVKT